MINPIIKSAITGNINLDYDSSTVEYKIDHKSMNIKNIKTILTLLVFQP